MDLSCHPHFVPWHDPETGHVSYILDERVVPVQKGFYFVAEDAASPDTECIWCSQGSDLVTTHLVTTGAAGAVREGGLELTGRRAQ